MQQTSRYYAAFFSCARIFAHLARCAAAIFRRAEADTVRFAGADPTDFATTASGCEFFRMLAHRAFCASAIFRREAMEIIRFCGVVLLGPAAFVPLNDSIPAMIWSNLSISICACLRF